MRRHVTPAHPRATILDPERGRRLPPGGAAVAWTAYWARLAERGDVTVVEVDQPGPEAVESAADPEPEHDAHG